MIKAVSRHADVHLLLAGKLTDDGERAYLASVTEVPIPPRPAPPGRTLTRARTLWSGLMAKDPAEVVARRPTRDQLGQALAGSPDCDVVMVQHMHLAQLLPPVRRNRWVISVEQLLTRRLKHEIAIAGRRRDRWLLRRELTKATRLEDWMVASYDLAVAVSPEDVTALGGRAAMVPNGVNLSQFTVTPLPAEPRILFAGTMDYLANVDGAEWFCREVLPLVQANLPSATLEVVGRRPVDRVRELSRLPGVAVHADVPDILPYFSHDRVVVVPIRIGSGTRFKALEAMAAGRPLVGTSLGLEGLGIEDGVHALVADDPARMADAICRLITDDAMARAMTSRARALVEGRFGWERVGEEFARVILDAPPIRPLV